MLNIVNVKGSFKGLIGEACFCSQKDKAILTRLNSRNKFSFLPKIIFDNWYSFDVISIKPLIIYEIKTCNSKNFGAFGKPKATSNQLLLLDEASKQGIKTIIAFVLIHEDGNFEVIEENYSRSLFCEDKPKKWDYL